MIWQVLFNRLTPQKSSEAHLFHHEYRLVSTEKCKSFSIQWKKITHISFDLGTLVNSDVRIAGLDGKLFMEAHSFIEFINFSLFCKNFLNRLVIFAKKFIIVKYFSN